ncbi:6400_t:CDS:10 [Entrophospora sp. SA101]|nr:6400_t:CDS:10 [Entrophospora sp. SA101]CAJ0869606.1 11902_t:CDS:10 [Entrophospora sp. SA101]
MSDFENTSLISFIWNVFTQGSESILHMLNNPNVLSYNGEMHGYQPNLWNFLYSPHLLLANAIINRINAIVAPQNPRPLKFKIRLLIRLPFFYCLVKSLLVLLARISMEISTLQSFLFQWILDLGNDCTDQQALWLTLKTFSAVYIMKAFHSNLEDRILPSREQGTSLYEDALLFHIFCDISSGKSNIDLLLIAFFGVLDMFLLEILYLHPSGPQYRFITTTIVGISGLAHYTNALFYRPDAYPIVQSFARFPELVLTILIIVCSLIHIMAYIVTGGNVRRRFFIDYTSLPSLSEDYTTELYRIGTIIIEMNRVEGFRNELPPIFLPSSTYLERPKNTRQNNSMGQINTLRPACGFDNLQDNNSSDSSELYIHALIRRLHTWTNFSIQAMALLLEVILRIANWIKSFAFQAEIGSQQAEDLDQDEGLDWDEEVYEKDDVDNDFDNDDKETTEIDSIFHEFNSNNNNVEATPVSKYRPIVIWHGMGDTCCNPESIGKVIEIIHEALPGVYVHSIMLGDQESEDKKAGFFGNVNDQILSVCEKLKNDENLKHGFNAIGFSQGGLLLRGYVERCNDPPVHNLVTFGAPHGGVSDIPGCMGDGSFWCNLMRSLVRNGAYNSYVRSHIVQAQYYKDSNRLELYLKQNIYLPDINNELNEKNQAYKKNLASLNKLILIRFTEDITLKPKDTAWFSFYNETGEMIDLIDQPLYKEDWIGLKELNENNKLIFKDCEGQHMQFSIEYLQNEVIIPYLSDEINYKKIELNIQ